MKVQCPGCHTAFIISAEKLEEKRIEGKTLRIACPKCKIPMDIDSKPPEPAGMKTNAVGGISGLSDPLSDFTATIDVVDEGQKTSLLCVSNTRIADSIAQVLQELDFWVVYAARSGFALGKLHHNTYDLIILEENFDAAASADNLVLHHVQLLPMHVRRQFYLCLLTETMPTMDAMLAFRMGVNLILNARDLEKAKIILARSMKEYKTFYSFFNAELNRKQA